MNVSEVAKRIAFSKAYEFLDRDPEQNFLKLVNWLEKLDKNGYVASQLPVIQKYASDSDNNWYKLALSLWNDVDDEVRKTLFTNFMLNGSVLDNRRLAENRKKYHCNIPWAITLDISADSQGRQLTFDDLDNVIEQGKSLGVYMYGFKGFDILERRSDLIALCNKNSECVFLCQTDGMQIDEEITEDLLRVKNCILILRVDGLREETDCCRGVGTFDRICKVMELLRKEKLLFGISCLYTSRNCDVICSEKFFDTMISFGVKFASFSAYMPVDNQADVSLLITAEQRERFHRNLSIFRKSKSLLTTDHWNDGEFMGGCLAGGRGYCHINTAGDVEPCLYIHYSDSNIHQKSLLKAFQSPLFMAFHNQQPFNKNLLRPCPLLDSPERIVQIIRDTKAASTLSQDAVDIADIAARCIDCAKSWAVTADRLWREAGHTV